MRLEKHGGVYYVKNNGVVLLETTSRKEALQYIAGMNKNT